MIFSALKWFAIARGAWRARKGRRLTLAEIDAVLREVYTRPILAALNQRSPLFEYVTRGEAS